MLAQLARVAALVLAACGGDETAAPPAQDSAPPPAPPSTPPELVPPPEVTDDPEPGGPSGLANLTREVIDEARREATDPLLLVPDAAQWITQVRPAELLSHSELRSLWSRGEESNDGLRTAMAVMRTCMGGVEALDRVVLGFDDHSHLVMVGHAKGLGTEATWRCLRDEAAARGESLELDITGTPRGEGPQLRENDKEVGKGDCGYFADDDTVVFVSKEWDADVRTLLRSEGTAASEGQLATTMKRVDAEASAWLVGRVTGIPATLMTGSPMASIVDMSLNAKVRAGDLELRFEADAGEPADATRVRDELTKQLELFKGMLPAMGFPSSVTPKLAFETEGDLVSMQLTLTADELRGLREGIERTF